MWLLAAFLELADNGLRNAVREGFCLKPRRASDREEMAAAPILECHPG
jgi:hypothetical protein